MKYMEIEDVKERIKKAAVFSTPTRPRGGQQVGVSLGPITLTSEELGFSLTIPIDKSQLKAKELAWALFDLYLDEVLR